MRKRGSRPERLGREILGWARDLIFFAKYYRYNWWRDVRMRIAHRDVLQEHREVMRKVREREQLGNR